MSKPFLYLVQASSDRLDHARSLVDRPTGNALFLTFDKAVEGALFLPKSTWGEGRNRLAEEARLRNDYDYALFLDDDIAFAKGDLARFEALLLRHRPAVACPVFLPKSLYTVLGAGRGLMSPPFRCLQAQPLRRGDCQLMALHRTAVEDGLIYPTQTRFDATSWWCTSMAVQALVVNLYGNRALQFNPVAVTNLAHRDYVRSSDFSILDRWLADQFRGPVDRPEKWAVNPFSGDGVRRIRHLLKGPLENKPRLFTDWIGVLAGALAARPSDDHGFTPDALARLLKPDSDLFRQYLAHSPRAPKK